MTKELQLLLDGAFVQREEEAAGRSHLATIFPKTLGFTSRMSSSITVTTEDREKLSIQLKRFRSVFPLLYVLLFKLNS